MLKKLFILFLGIFSILDLSGCALNTGSIHESGQIRQKLKFSYIQALVMVKNALKSENIQFENAIVTKKIAELKGVYPNGRVVHIVISKINDSESDITVSAGMGEASREDARKILSSIFQYSQSR